MSRLYSQQGNSYTMPQKIDLQQLNSDYFIIAQ